jgi:hypothetical protein
MTITDIKMTIGGSAVVWLNLADFNVLVAAVSGVVFLGYGATKWYFLIKNKGE